MWGVYFFGNICFEDHDAGVYLVFGTLIEVMERPVAAFFTMVGGLLVIGFIFLLLTVFVGGFFIYVFPALIVLFSVIRLIGTFVHGHM